MCTYREDWVSKKRDQVDFVLPQLIRLKVVEGGRAKRQIFNRNSVERRENWWNIAALWLLMRWGFEAIYYATSSWLLTLRWAVELEVVLISSSVDERSRSALLTACWGGDGATIVEMESRDMMEECCDREVGLRRIAVTVSRWRSRRAWKLWSWEVQNLTCEESRLLFREGEVQGVEVQECRSWGGLKLKSLELEEVGSPQFKSWTAKNRGCCFGKERLFKMKRIGLYVGPQARKSCTESRWIGKAEIGRYEEIACRFGNLLRSFLLFHLHVLQYWFELMRSPI